MSNFTMTFSVFGNRYYFTPKFTLVSLLLIAVLIGLGMWQLHQARHITHMSQLRSTRMNLDAVHVDDLATKNDLRFYPIEVHGTFDNQHQILLSNRLYKGQLGYEVLTPFKMVGASSEILVDRGWIPASSDLNKTLVNTAPDNAQVNGMLFKPVNYFVFGADFDADKVQWPLVSKRANTKKLSKALNAPLSRYIILLSSDSSYGYVREWTWLKNSPDRNYALARQWFVLAGLVLVVFLFTNIHRGEY